MHETPRGRDKSVPTGVSCIFEKPPVKSGLSVPYWMDGEPLKLFTRWQPDTKRGALAQFAFHGEDTAMSFGNKRGNA